MKLHLSAVVFLLVCSVFGIASNNQSQEGKDLIEKAAEKMNIFALPDFEMKGNVRIDNQGKPLDGTYFCGMVPTSGGKRLIFPATPKFNWGAKVLFFSSGTSISCHCGLTSYARPWVMVPPETLFL